MLCPRMACPFIPRKLTLCRFGLRRLRTALGTFRFWRQYVQGYADIMPLTLLLKEGVVWRWRKDVEQASFDRLKSAVAHAPVLMHTDVAKPFVIVSDASDFAVGASLEQTGDDGRRRPVSSYSHKLNQAERKYPVHERELLPIVLSLRVWRHLCYNPESVGSQAPGPDVCTRRGRSDIPCQGGQYVLTVVSRHYVACEHLTVRKSSYTQASILHICSGLVPQSQGITSTSQSSETHLKRIRPHVMHCHT